MRHIGAGVTTQGTKLESVSTLLLTTAPTPQPRLHNSMPTGSMGMHLYARVLPMQVQTSGADIICHATIDFIIN